MFENHYHVESVDMMKIQPQYPPATLSLEEKEDFVMTKIEEIKNTILDIRGQIRRGDRRNKGRQNSNYSIWRDKARNAIKVKKVMIDKYMVQLRSIQRQLKIAKSTPLDEARLFVAAAQEILDASTFNQIRNIAQRKKNL